MHHSCHFICIILLCCSLPSPLAMTKTVERIAITPAPSCGTERFITVHKYGPEEGTSTNCAVEKCYIQASLHSDEVPAMLVAHKLIKLLDDFDARGVIQKQIIVVPHANPIGLSQNILNSGIGRFSMSTGVNFNRGFTDISSSVLSRIEGKLSMSSESENVDIIRKAILEEIDLLKSNIPEVNMKKQLLRLAINSDVVFDLHSDADAIIHMYTHDKLWPELADIASCLGTEAHLLAPTVAGNCFDEVCSYPWAAISEKYPDYPVPMACQSATIELRGESDVFDEVADKDAMGLVKFLLRRKYISSSTDDQMYSLSLVDIESTLCRQATPLSGVDMIEASMAGVIVYTVDVGSTVKTGDQLGYIMCTVSGEQRPIVTEQSGIFFARRLRKLAFPGLVVAKVAGKKPLASRDGKNNLLTSR